MGDGPLQIACLPSSAVNSHDREIGPRLVRGEPCGTKAIASIGVPPLPNVKSAAGVWPFMSQTRSVSPENCTPGFVASQRPSPLRTKKLTDPCERLATLFSAATSQRFTPNFELTTSHRALGVTASP